MGMKQLPKCKDGACKFNHDNKYCTILREKPNGKCNFKKELIEDIARRIYPDIPAVFIDTGLEYPEIRDFVKTKPNVIWVKPKMNFRKTIESYGYPIISKEVAEKISSA